LVFNALYVLLFLPFAVTRIFNLFTEVYSGPLFSGLRPPQGEVPDPSLGWLGTLVILGYVSVTAVVFAGVVMRWDPQARRADPAFALAATR
jgi:hypothetical protein